METISMVDEINIEQIIEEENIVIYFQPIISTYQDRVAGVEALVRGLREDGSLISPLLLFEAAREAGKVIELDRLCQRKAMEAFGRRHLSQKDLILFVNVDNSVIHLDCNTNAIHDYAIANELNPENIVLEINELQSADLSAVKKFVGKYRALGFMISIDDVGAGYSNLDRVVLLKPDIIKIDKELIRYVDQNYFKQQVVQMIIRMSEKTGAIVVAEGVESLEEIMTVLGFGAQLLQGFYISKPMDMRGQSLAAIETAIRRIAAAQKEHLAETLTERCNQNLRLRDSFDRFNRIMKASEVSSLSKTLGWILENFPEVECAYVIDEDGLQMTDTVFNRTLPEIHMRSLFSPYRKGDDAKLKPYYYVLRTTNQPIYVSEEYLSLASGHRCITISGYSYIGARKVILCLDVVSNDT